MIRVDRRRYIETATPEYVFAALSDPHSIEKLLPRMHKVEIRARQGNSARVVTHMSIGGIFGTIPCEGQLEWVEPHEIIFHVQKPLPIEVRWNLDQAVNGTDLTVDMRLDLAPLLGPMASFVPNESVADMIGKELDHALKEMSVRLARSMPRERAVAA